MLIEIKKYKLTLKVDAHDGSEFVIHSYTFYATELHSVDDVIAHYGIDISGFDILESFVVEI